MEMKTWDVKLIDFLSGSNVIEIEDAWQYQQLQDIFHRIGLGILDRYPMFVNLINYRTKEGTVIIEYQNHKGLCLGWKSRQEAIDWYGVEPLTAQEIIEEQN